MNESIGERVDQLITDKLHGASWLTLYALETLILAIENSQANNMVSFLREISTLTSELSRAKPSMISISNSASAFLHQIYALAQKYPSLSSLKSEALSRGKLLLKRMQNKIELAVKNGAGIIRDGESIMTCSYSSIVCQALVVARKKGVQFKIFTCDSSFKNVSYGQQMKDILAQDQIKTTVINTNVMAKYLKRCDKVITGADAILHNGNIINGTPSLQLASTASILQVPYFIICEDVKFDTYRTRDNIPVENGFDLIPSALWAGIITESGLLEHTIFKKHMENQKNAF